MSNLLISIALVFQKGKTPLHLSCEHGHKDVVHFLLNSKAYINAKTKLGLTALHLAAQKGYKDIVEMLVTSFNASIDALSLVRLYLLIVCNKIDAIICV